jgi:ribonuclease HI
MLIEIHTDGLAMPTNPGIGTFGYVIYVDGKRTVARHGFAGEPVTNNYAEYEGVVKALREVEGRSDEKVVVYSDSKLVVNQMSGEWRFKKGTYVDKYLEAKELAAKFGDLTFKWIPREQNAEADELSRIAYAQALARKRAAPSKG